MGSNNLEDALEEALRCFDSLSVHPNLGDVPRRKAQAASGIVQRLLEDTKWLGENHNLGNILEKNETGVRSIESCLTVEIEDASDDLWLVRGREKLTSRRYLDGNRIIHSFYKLGADPTAATVFSGKAYRAARYLVDNIGILGGWLRYANFRLQNREYEFTITLPRNSNIGRCKQAFRHLHTLGLLTKRPAIYKSNGSFRVKTQVIEDTKVVRFLRGHWLSAFSRWLIEEQAIRNNANVDLAALLEVQLPPEIPGLSKTEYDVVALIERNNSNNHMLWIECKSGSIEQLLKPASIRKMASSIGALRQALGVLGGEFSLEGACIVQAPRSEEEENNRDELRNRLAEFNIQVFELLEFRAYINQLFRNLP